MDSRTIIVSVLLSAAAISVTVILMTIPNIIETLATGENWLKENPGYIITLITASAALLAATGTLLSTWQLKSDIRARIRPIIGRDFFVDRNRTVMLIGNEIQIKMKNNGTVPAVNIQSVSILYEKNPQYFIIDNRHALDVIMIKAIAHDAYNIIEKITQEFMHIKN